MIDATEEQFDRLVSTNLRGVWLCLRHELRRMRAAGGGAIVNVNSVSGARPTDAQAIYGMTKRAVTHLTQSAAREAGKDGVRVNEILPALLMTDMVRSYFEGPNAVPLEPVVARLALRRAGEPEDGANAILFLCYEQASYIPGASLPVDGGFLLYNAGAA